MPDFRRCLRRMSLQVLGTVLVGSLCAIAVGTAAGSSSDSSGNGQAVEVSESAIGPGVYSPLTPARICDTRVGNPSLLSGEAAQCNGVDNAGSTLAARGTLNIDLAGEFDVPSLASAVVLNVTVVNPASAGYLTVFPAGQSPPTASNLNYVAGEVVPNLVEVGIGSSGEISIYSSASTDVVVDLEGYVASTSALGAGGGLYNALGAPERICDTRPNDPSELGGEDAQCDGSDNSGETLPAGATLDIEVTGAGDVPSSGVSAVVLNVTAVDPGTSGFITVYPEGGSLPITSNVNFIAGQVVPNRVIVPLSSSGQISIYSSAPSDVLVDVSGWYSASSGTTGDSFTAEASPERICDTRPGNPSGLSGANAQCNGDTIAGGVPHMVNVAGLAGVPSSGASAVVLNVTAVDPSLPTYLSIFPSGSLPTVSDLNPSPGEVESNLVVARLSSGGAIEIYSYNAYGTVDVVVDVLGWYSS